MNPHQELQVKTRPTSRKRPTDFTCFPLVVVTVLHLCNQLLWPFLDMQYIHVTTGGHSMCQTTTIFTECLSVSLGSDCWFAYDVVFVCFLSYPYRLRVFIVLCFLFYCERPCFPLCSCEVYFLLLALLMCLSCVWLSSCV